VTSALRGRDGEVRAVLALLDRARAGQRGALRTGLAALIAGRAR
jgi:hypothetical protein